MAARDCLMSKIDIVLPVRNGERYLAEALTSLCGEARLINRLFLVDDGSTDRTVDIARNFQQAIPIEILQGPPRGIVASLNAGLNAATTDYVARMDADDICLPHRLKRQIEFLDANSEIDVVGAQAAFIDQSGVLTGQKTNYPLSPRQVRSKLLTKGCVVCHRTVLLRRKAVLKLGGYRAAFALAEDHDLWLRLSDTLSVANLPDVLLHYRVHPEQVTKSRNPRRAFTRDLAVWCARQRASGKAEPTELLRFTGTPSEPASHAHAPPFVARLAKVHASIAQFEVGQAKATRSELEEIMSFVRERHIGGGRRGRYKLLKSVRREFARRGEWASASKAFLTEIRCRLTDAGVFRVLSWHVEKPSR